MEMNELKIGIVGFGRMGRVHFKSCEMLHLRVSAIVDPNVSAVEEFFRNYSDTMKPKIYSSMDLFLENSDAEFLIVATTADLHHPLIMQALGKSRIKNILCEKPIANQLSLAKEIVSTCLENGVGLAVNHQMRFLPQYRLIRDLISDEKYGRFANMLVSGSNFGLGMNATHYFEAFRWITDCNVGEVTSWIDPQPVPSPRGAQFSDQSGILMARNLVGNNLVISFSQNVGHQVLVAYEFEFAKVLINEITGEVIIDARFPEDYAQPTTRYGLSNSHKEMTIAGVELENSTASVLRAFLNNSDYPTGDDGLHAISVAFMAISSSTNGGTPTTLESISDSDIKVEWA